MESHTRQKPANYGSLVCGRKYCLRGEGQRAYQTALEMANVLIALTNAE